MSQLSKIAARLRPLGNRVLVHKRTLDNVSAGGIILSKAPRSNEGTVVAVGPGFRNQDGELIAMNVTVKDTVYLPEYGGVKLNGEGTDDDGEYIIYREDELLGTLAAEDA